MKELGRILSNRRFAVGLLLILLVNGFLFARDQSENNYRLDLEVPGGGLVAFGSAYTVTQEPVDARAAYRRYSEWLEQVRDMPLEDAASFLKEEKKALTEKIDEASGISAGTSMFGTGAESETEADTAGINAGTPDANTDISGTNTGTTDSDTDISETNTGTTDSDTDIGTPDANDTDRLDYVAVNNLLAQTDYLTGYDDWLNSVQENKENLLTFSIFNNPNSFTGRNIIKTAKEFEKLQGVTLTIGADKAVEAFLSFSLTDYFLLLMLLLFGISFLEERKAGLWSVVHASPNGRTRLAIHRVLILLGASVCSVLLLYGTNLLIGFLIYGGPGDLWRTVQSIETLGRLPVLTTAAGFLIRFFLLRIAAAFLISLILWLLLTAINNVKYTIIAAAGVLTAEYGLYTFLPVQSAFNLLKYFNLFTYISLSDLYTNYLNIDLFGWPLGIRSISQFALIPLCLFSAAACIYIHCHKKPAAGRDLLGKAAYGINSVTDKFLRRLHLFGMELHKTLWIQKSVVIAALFVYAAAGLSYTVNIRISSSEEMASRQYTAEFAGEITDDTFARMDAEQAELDKKTAAYEAAKIDYENNLIEYSDLDEYRREASLAETHGKGLAAVRLRAEELQHSGAEKGFTPWLIDETPFESVYGSLAQYHQHQAAVTALLALTLLLAGSMTYERQSGMIFVLKSTVRGRGALLLRKLFLAIVMTTFVWAVVYGRELYAFLSRFSVSAWSAPACNLSMLTEFPVSFSITGWLVMTYACRFLCLLCCAVIVLFISNDIRRMEAAYIASGSIMLLPSLLYAYMDIAVFRRLAVILPIEVMPLLTAADGAVSGILQWIAALAGITVLLTAWLFVSIYGISPKRN